MQDLTHFELVKLADVAREHHDLCPNITNLLQDYLDAWSKCHDARPGATTQDLKAQSKARRALIAHLSALPQ